MPRPAGAVALPLPVSAGAWPARQCCSHTAHLVCWLIRATCCAAWWTPVCRADPDAGSRRRWRDAHSLRNRCRQTGTWRAITRWFGQRPVSAAKGRRHEQTQCCAFFLVSTECIRLGQYGMDQRPWPWPQPGPGALTGRRTGLSRQPADDRQSPCGPDVAGQRGRQLRRTAADTSVSVYRLPVRPGRSRLRPFR